MTTSLVTGGAGFIGSHLVDALLARGDSVRVLDDFSTGKMENLDHARDRIELIEGDFRDLDLIQKALQGVDLLFHQGAFVSVPQSLEQPDICLDTNVRGTRQLLEASREYGVQRVVLASSAAVYGQNPHLPLQEDSKPDLLSPYAASKFITEIFAELYTHQLGLDVIALRYFNVYGPRQNPDSDYAAVIPIFIKRLGSGKEPVIYGDGGQSRDFIYISDVVQANLLAGEKSTPAGKAINICSGTEINLLELISSLEAIFDRDVQPVFQEPRAGDIYRSLGDPSLAEELLGFQASVPLLDGLQETTAWIKGTGYEQ